MTGPALPFSLSRLDHLLLLVDGMDAAEHFYRDVIGCTVETRIPRFAMIEMRAGESKLDLVDIAAEEGAWARPAREGGRNLDHFCLATGPWDEPAMRAHLARHCVEIIEERREGEGLSFYLRDPSGNVVELLRGPPEAGSSRSVPRPAP